MKRLNQKGFSIVTVMAAGTFVLGMCYLWLSRSSSEISAKRDASLKTDILTFKQGLLSEIDCSKTFSGYNPSVSCETTPPGRDSAAISLKNSSGQLITGAGGTKGQFTLEAYCREKVSSAGVGLNSYYLSVRSTLKDNSGAVQTDKYKVPFNYTHPWMQ